MEAFLLASVVVALAEVGDKTQLLALALTARSRRPWLICAGILVATVVNHAAASAFGAWIGSTLNPFVLGWIVAVTFFAMAIWMWVPDHIDEQQSLPSAHGVFWTTTVLFFIAEIGDKTQIATVGLAAHYNSMIMVTVGTTFGMLFANVPVVLLGNRLTARLPVRTIHVLASLLFVVLGMLTVIGTLLM